MAWESEPTIRRLVTVVAAGRRASQERRAPDSLVTPASLVAARRSRRGLDAIPLIVRGDLTSATALLPDTGDRADQSSVGLVVVPVLLAAASGASGHPAWPKSELAGMLAELDREDHLYEPSDGEVRPADGLTIAGLLAHAPLPPDQAPLRKHAPRGFAERPPSSTTVSNIWSRPPNASSTTRPRPWWSAWPKRLCTPRVSGQPGSSPHRPWLGFPPPRGLPRRAHQGATLVATPPEGEVRCP